MRICHYLPFLYVLIRFTFNVFYIKSRYYPYILVLSNKERFVLLSGRSGIRIPSGVPKEPSDFRRVLCFACRPDLSAFLPQAKIIVRLGRALAGNSPPDCCIRLFKSVLVQKRRTPKGVRLFWRYRPDLNWRITVLQTVALPLGYGTI